MNDEHITIYSHSNPKLNRVLYFHRIRRHKLVVGFGVQWNPSSPVDLPPAATLQLCIGSQCLIFQLTHANAVPLALRRFLADPLNTFVGVWNHRDEVKLSCSKHGLKVSRLVDAREVAAERKGSTRQISMEGLAEIILGAGGVEKPTWIGCSDWGNHLLSLDQVRYACVDAHVSFELGRALKAWNWEKN
ncbi:Mevalonate/galactokinase family protein isoform 1 [Hibiscus syriacus]|uniref:Mevalonate/galactokinase family protein isoform 1 n=1 Tax=Hibiscus syriacus TaxID=106335 RepID=A0A6A2YVL5_HIBSY|nr:Mevalonate/galactokinase family protein isoform 1 [Hibiscus syriacus]